MPVNKSAYARYRIIDDVLNYKKYADLQMLLESCERKLDTSFGERTIKKDIADMRMEFDAPIEFDKMERGYFYAEPFSMQTSIPLKSNDLSALQFAAQTLSHLGNISILSDFKETVNKIIKAIKIKETTQVQSRSFIQFEKVPNFKGSELLNDFVYAIQEKHKINIDYHSFDGDTTQERILEPYLLKEYRNRWYVIGFDELRQGIRIFGLDRIDNLKILDKVFELPQDFNPDVYFKHSLGITVFPDQQPQEIQLLFLHPQAKYIETQPIHELQEVEYTPEGLLVKLPLLITYELVAEIMSYGSQVRVIQPHSLTKMIKEQFTKALDWYNESD